MNWRRLKSYQDSHHNERKWESISSRDTEELKNAQKLNNIAEQCQTARNWRRLKGKEKKSRLEQQHNTQGMEQNYYSVSSWGRWTPTSGEKQDRPQPTSHPEGWKGNSNRQKEGAVNIPQAQWRAKKKNSRGTNRPRAGLCKRMQ